jgi:hypothetical protein
VASLAIAAVGTTQGTGAFYYDAVHLPVSITAAAPVIAQECRDRGFGQAQGSQAGFNHAVIAIGTDGDDTLVLRRNGPAVDQAALATSPLAGRISHPTNTWHFYAFNVKSWTVGEKLNADDLGPENNQAFIVLGGRGDDVIIGDNKNDCLVGGEGNDLLYGDNSEDVLVGGPDHDWIFGGNGVDTDCSENDSVNGGNGPDECDSVPTSHGNSGNGKSGSPATQDLTTAQLSGSTVGDEAPGGTADGTTTDVTTTDDTMPPSQAAGPSQEGTTG